MWRITTLAVLVVFGLTSHGWAGDDRRIITVTGNAQVDGAPDMAIINLGVTNEAKEAKAAMDATSASVARILEHLAAMGIEERDMQTSRFSINPVWNSPDPSRGDPRKITGFVASNAVSVRVRDLKALGQIMDSVISDGANSFNGLQFTLQDAEPLQREARTRAVMDAKEKATQLAEAAGVRLGPVLSISENGGGGRRPMMVEMSDARSSGAPIATGEVSVSASVTVVFEILDWL